MRDSDINIMSNFLSRMGMYICPSERESVVSFLTGYELGTDGLCTFTDTMSSILAEKYKIKLYATGWPDQLERFAEKNKMNWIQGFELVASEALNEFSNQQHG